MYSIYIIYIFHTYSTHNQRVSHVWDGAAVCTAPNIRQLQPLFAHPTRPHGSSPSAPNAPTRRGDARPCTETNQISIHQPFCTIKFHEIHGIITIESHKIPWNSREIPMKSPWKPSIHQPIPCSTRIPSAFGAFFQPPGGRGFHGEDQVGELLHFHLQALTAGEIYGDYGDYGD